MRNPNGYGSVYKLSGNRRKPWIARITTGWDDNGKQLFQTLGYYETRKDGLQVLADYAKNPYTMESSILTFKNVFDLWKEGKFEGISKSNVNGYNAAFKVSEQLHDIKFVDLRTKHLQDVIRTCSKGHGSLRKIKVLFNQLFKFAMENDIVNKDYSNFVDIGKNKEESKRKAFTQKEINRLFEVVSDIEYVDTILIMIYSGMRIGELLTVENKNIDLEKRLLIGGLKTEAGKDRIIPINDKIFSLIEKRFDLENEYLISKQDGQPVKYSNYLREKFEPIMEQLGFQHTPHDCRHTFATLMSNARADTIALQKIIGHASYTTTANTYTHKDFEQLKKAVNLI